jgi:replicative DNA helicase
MSLLPVEAQSALIARLLLNPDDIGKIDGLQPEDFSNDWGKAVFAAIVRRHRAGEHMDAALLADETGMKIDVMELSPASFAPVEEYVKVIQEAATRRSLVQTLDRAKFALSTGEDPMSTMQLAFDAVLKNRGIEGMRLASEVVKSYRSAFTRRSKGVEGIPYGVEPLDANLMPLTSGRLVVIASRPGVGKTALAETISDTAAQYGPVLHVSLEMSAEELMDRAMARMSGISAQEIMRGTVEPERIEEHLVRRGDLPITYMDDGSSTTADILSAAQRVRMQNDGKLGLVIVDYLQLVSDKGDNEVYRVGSIAHALKRMSLKLKVPVLALAQLNRAIEHDRRPPRLSDLRDSGAIEQDADVVVVMTGDPMGPEREAHILKQRQGHTGRVALFFDGDTQTWSDPVRGASVW